MHTLLFCLTGCTTIQYQDGTATFTRTSFGTQLQITELNASTDEHGNRTIKLIGYVSDQVQAMEKIAEGAARGAATAIKP
jgi:hypothetical protein